MKKITLILAFVVNLISAHGQTDEHGNPVFYSEQISIEQFDGFELTSIYYTIDSNIANKASSVYFTDEPTLSDYLKLLDWPGRQLRTGKRGSIPEHLAPILTRIGLDGSSWCNLIEKFGRTFKRAVGSVERLASEAQRRGQGPATRWSVAFRRSSIARRPNPDSPLGG